MKRKINFICILIFISLAISITVNVLDSVFGSMQIWSTLEDNPIEMAEMDQTEDDFFTIVSLRPDEKTFKADTIFNQINQKTIAYQHSEIIAQVDPNFCSTVMIPIILVLLSMIILALFGLTYFIKLIIEINHQNIFSWKNVSLLRKTGSIILLIFLLNLLLEYFNYIHLSQAFSFEGYTLAWNYRIDLLQIVFGFVCFLFAEIFALGLKIKEEQDLTI